MIPLLVGAFVLSGAAGLIYESIWTRYLGLFVGHSAYAQVIVLVIFLGGMAIGAHIASDRSSRLRSPLLWYAGIELVVGIMALGFHDAFTGMTTFAYDTLFPASTGMALVVAKWSVAGALILPQSVLLGATFPLMSAGVIRIARKETEPGRTLALLYFANSIGAAAGVLIAGFMLVQLVGLPGTIMVAGFVNIIVAMAVGLVARSHQRLAQGAGLEATGLEQVLQSPDTRGPDWRPLLFVAFGTAVASFIYEIAWIRMLSLVLGSATHSFELMLSAFILGLALGALWIRSRADHIADPVRFLGVVQWVMGLLAIATLPLYVASFQWVGTLLHTVQANQNGYRVFLLSRYVVALLVMVPATFCAGMTLPLITRVLMRGGAGERAIGSVYAFNTLGSIVGVILAALVLLPLLGLKALLVVGALVDIGLGVWLIARRGGAVREIVRRGIGRFRPTGGLGLTAALVATAIVMAFVPMAAPFDLARLTSGVYRHGQIASPSDFTFLFYRDGRTATVSMRRGLDGFVTLATNGKPDASMDKAWMDSTNASSGLVQLTRDLATQLLLPIITLAHSPRAENVAVIGHGSGMSSHVLLGSPHIKQVVTIEIEPEMINASRGFRPANRRVFEDPRSTFVIDDAKSYFASAGRRFDLILSEPSNPWVSGVSGLFTVEFYQRVKGKLGDTGVFGQWLHLYELSDGLALSVLAAIDTVFADYEIFFTSNADILVVAANHTLPVPDWGVTGFAGIAAELRRVVPMAPDQLEALRLGGRSVLGPMILLRGAANSDYYPVLDLSAELTRFLQENADGLTGMSEGRFDIVAALADHRAEFGTSAVSPTPEIPRPEGRAVGASLQAIRTLPTEIVSSMKRNSSVRAAAYRVDQLERVSSGSRPPADWHAWMDAVLVADADLHTGTAGVVDSAFFSRLRQFVARAGAPVEARAAIDFLHGIGAWNWAETLVSARALESSKDSLVWIPNVLLRNGTVVALIKLREYEKAKEALRVFAPRTVDDSFREVLLGSYLVYADSTIRAAMGWK